MDEYKFKELLAEETEASELTRDEVPAGKGERLNRGNRSVVFSLRLNHEELEALQAIAERANLPASTLARSWLVEQIRRAEQQASRVDFAFLAEAKTRAAWPPGIYGSDDLIALSDNDYRLVRAAVRQEFLRVFEGMESLQHVRVLGDDSSSSAGFFSRFIDRLRHDDDADLIPTQQDQESKPS